MKKLRQFVINALMLSGVSCLMRAVGVVFQIYIARKVGTEALGLNALFSSVYGFALTLASSGLYMATTTLTAQALSFKDSDHSPRPILRICFLWGAFFGLFSASLLYFGSSTICLHFLEEPRAIRPLRIMALTLPFISLSTAVNGYFTACRRVYKNAIVSVFEQIVRITATILLLSAKGGTADAERACISLVIGNMIAEFCSCALSFILYLFDKRRYTAHTPKQKSFFNRIHELAAVAIPIALSSYVRSALLSLEHALIPICLRKSGATQAAALSAYGILGSMVFPVILFPTALLSSFSGLLVPELTECQTKNNKIEISYIAGRVYSLSLWFSIGIAAVFCLFSDSFGAVIYNNEEAGRFIRMLAPLVPIMYLDNTTDSMLKGLGQQVYSMYVNIADALLSVILVWLLLPHMGTPGYVLVIYITELFNTAFSVLRLLTVTHLRTQTVKWVFKPLLCAVGATSFTHLLLKILPPIPDSVPALVFHVMIAAFTYMVLLRGIHAVGKEEINWFSKIVRREKSK